MFIVLPRLIVVVVIRIIAAQHGTQDEEAWHARNDNLF